MRTFVIAEAGVNHNGDLGTAFKLVEAAAQAGADAVKFQTFTAEKVVTATTAQAEYQKTNTGTDISQREMLKRLELSAAGFRELFLHCKSRNILFMSTPFDAESTDMLDAMGMSIFKIPSGEITNKALIEHIATKAKPIILSTGMSYMEEVEKAVLWINTAWDALGQGRPNLTLLHCTSNYPAAFEDVNLLAMKKMEGLFRVPVGYSDHTMGIEIPIAAVALGARVIEKHFTLDRNMDGPDHKASLEPEELGDMVQAIRNIEKAIGDGEKRPAESEENIRSIARRSLVAARDLAMNETVMPGDIAIKRPASGILPEFREAVVGMRVKRKIPADSPLKWEDLENA